MATFYTVGYHKRNSMHVHIDDPEERFDTLADAQKVADDANKQYGPSYIYIAITITAPDL